MCSQIMARNTQKNHPAGEDDVARARGVINRELKGQPRQGQEPGQETNGGKDGKGDTRSAPHGRPGDA